MPLLSIVIANYNYGRFLAEAIESVLAQKVEKVGGGGQRIVNSSDVELIIIDGGSTDNSVEVIQKYAGGLPPGVEREKCLNGGIGECLNGEEGKCLNVEMGECLNDEGRKVGRESRLTKDVRLSNSNIQTFRHSNNSLISYWISEPDKGQSNAFNKGFARARGRFLTWLNADDVMLPGTIEKLKTAAEKHPYCEWFVGGVLWLDPEMRIINCGRGRPFSEIRYREGNVSVWGPSSFFTKRLLDSVGGVDERFHFTMDTDLWLRFACKANARYRPFCDYAWGLRLHPDAKMSGHNFTADGKLDTEHTEAEKISASKHRAQMDQESRWRSEYFTARKATRLSHILSVSWPQVLTAKRDLMHWRGKHYQEAFK